MHLHCLEFATKLLVVLLERKPYGPSNAWNFFLAYCYEASLRFLFSKALWHCIKHGIALQGGKQLVGLVGKPDKRNDIRESMDLDGVRSGAKLRK
jgi:hypothetical protein